MEDALTKRELADIAQHLPKSLRELDRLTDLDLEPDEPMSARSMLHLVEQAQKLLSEFYVHLSQKRALHAADPELRLRLLAGRLEEMIPNEGKPAAEKPTADLIAAVLPHEPEQPRPNPTPITEAQFHDEMTAIFTSLRDRHTIYLLPERFRRRIAFLPFLIEECVEPQATEPESAKPRSTYLVTKCAFELPRNPEFKEGLVVTHWNGMKIDRAVDLNGAINPGSNSAARHARGLDMLAFRWLGMSPQPVEDWVVLTFQVDGEERHLRFPWLVVKRPRESDPGRREGVDAPNVQDFDREGEWIRWVRKQLYAPRYLSRESRPHPHVTWRVHPGKSSGRRYGYLRIFSFDVDDGKPVEEFRDAVASAVQAEPTNGLIIDIRGNPGGNLLAGESLLQLFTPHRITPEGLQFRNTSAATKLASNFHSEEYSSLLADLAKVADLRSMIVEATATAPSFFSSPPAVPSGMHNDVGQIYQQPVVLIVDALCYSTSDVFAAGFQDHKIGKVLGTSRQTGAGGGNVWTGEEVLDIFEMFDDPKRKLEEPELPSGANFELAVRRITRVGDRAGVALEDLGVVADHEHPLTRKDLRENNADLIERAIAILADEKESRPAYYLRATHRPGDEEFDLTASPNLARVDVYINERPLGSLNPKSESVIDVAGIEKLETARFLGYSGENGRQPDVAYLWRAP